MAQIGKVNDVKHVRRGEVHFANDLEANVMGDVSFTGVGKAYMVVRAKAHFASFNGDRAFKPKHPRF